MKTTADLAFALKALRKAHGLSQAKLASKLGVSQQMYSKIEKSGDTSTTTLLTLLALLDQEMAFEPRNQRPITPERTRLIKQQLEALADDD